MIRKTLALTAAAALLLTGCSAGADSSAPPPPAVTVATPLVREVADWDEYVGKFEAIEAVEVRPRATGYLTSVHFRDGEFVRKGQLLFTIDAREAQAALAQAQAQLAQAQAAHANAETELARTRALAEQRAASQEELESRTATLRSAAAQVAAARAAVRARELEVGFTRVTAPISGRISERRVDPGNSVAADQTVLTTIVSVDPLHFSFTGSEASLLKYQRNGRGVAEGTPVRVRLADEPEFNRIGRLDFIDNAIDPTAGTIRARAIIPNPDGFLKPGMFGNLRLEASRPYTGLMIPDTAVVADASRRIVYVVDKDGTVQARPVELGPLSNNLRVIRSGIARNDRVVIGGVQRARPGLKVTARPGRIEEAKLQEVAPSTPPPSAVAQPVSGR